MCKRVTFDITSLYMHITATATLSTSAPFKPNSNVEMLSFIYRFLSMCNILIVRFYFSVNDGLLVNIRKSEILKRNQDVTYC